MFYPDTPHVRLCLFICLYEHDDLGKGGNEAESIWGDDKAEILFKKFSFTILNNLEKNSIYKVKPGSHILTSLHPQLNNLKIKIHSCLRVVKSS